MIPLITRVATNYTEELGPKSEASLQAQIDVGCTDFGKELATLEAPTSDSPIAPRRHPTAMALIRASEKRKFDNDSHDYRKVSWCVSSGAYGSMGNGLVLNVTQWAANSKWEL